MDNMESLYQEFKKYFYREKIEYFLDVLKIVKEDRWEYEYEKLTITDTFFYIIKTLKYDNIKIKYDYHYTSDDDIYSHREITVKVDNETIYKEEEDETSELFVEIIAFIERAEQRGRK